MKKVTKKAVIDYEQPQMEIIQLHSEQCLAGSTQLDDMQETEGSWDLNY